MRGIKQIRLIKGLTQTDLAKLVGVTQQMVSLWECGRSINLHKKEILREILIDENTQAPQKKES